jgi:phosphohistidine phosphatase
MDLYLLRHGIAVELGEQGYTKDSARPLTAEGIDKLKKIAKAMSAMELEFDLILSSPYLRARQTAEIVAERFKNEIDYTDLLVPHASPLDTLEELRKKYAKKKSILLVGHNPNLSVLISYLTCPDDNLVVLLKKGGLCKLEFEGKPERDGALLAYLLTPKQMTKIS